MNGSVVMVGGCGLGVTAERAPQVRTGLADAEARAAVLEDRHREAKR